MRRILLLYIAASLWRRKTLFPVKMGAAARERNKKLKSTNFYGRINNSEILGESAPSCVFPLSTGRRFWRLKLKKVEGILMITRTLDAKLAAAAKSFPYKTREGGATVTVFVPYDCKNNCPFCVNKEEYADCTGFSLEAIKKAWKRWTV